MDVYAGDPFDGVQHGGLHQPALVLVIACIPVIVAVPDIKDGLTRGRHGLLPCSWLSSGQYQCDSHAPAYPDPIIQGIGKVIEAAHTRCFCILVLQ